MGCGERWEEEEEDGQGGCKESDAVRVNPGHQLGQKEL